MFSNSITLVSVQFPHDMDFRILLEVNTKRGKSIMASILESATNINPKFYIKKYIYIKRKRNTF